MTDIMIGLTYMVPGFIGIIGAASSKSDLHPPYDPKMVDFVAYASLIMFVLGLIYLIKGSYQVP